jgi:lysophospholipase L1-like esterase
MSTITQSSRRPEAAARTESVPRRRSTPPQLGWSGAFGGIVGIAVGLLVVLDVNRVAMPLAFLAAVVAHGCLGLVAIDVASRVQSMRDTTVSHPRLRICGLVVGAAVLVVVLWKLDGLVLASSAGDFAKSAYVILALAAFFGFGVSASLVFSAVRFKGRKEQVGWQALAGLGAFTAGVVAVALVIGAAALWRQTDVPDDAIAVPPIEGIEGNYVALGDSYSAGEGLGDYEDGTDDGGDRCHRSALAYPQLLRFEGARTEVESRACASAMSVDIYEPHERSTGVTIEAQLDGAVHPEVGLVTITVGGNDVIFSRVVRACFLFEDCINARFSPPASSRPSVVYPDPRPLDEWGEAAVASLSPRMATVTSELRRQFPNARVLMIGYPYLFPDGSAPWDHADCASVLRRVDQGERHELRALTDRLNNFLYAHAVAAGIEFVSPADAWDGHEPCGKDGQYTNAVKPVLSLPNFLDGGTFHPNQRGHEQLARLVSCYLGEHPSPPNPFTDRTPRPLEIDGLIELDDLGLVPPPGSIEEPVSCGTG